MINKDNIESYIIDYIDGELTEEAQNALLQYIDDNPDAQALLEAYQGAVFTIDEPMMYPNKDALLKKTVLPFYQKSIFKVGVAAALLVAATGAFLQWNQSGESLESISKIVINVPLSTISKVDSGTDITPIATHTAAQQLSSNPQVKILRMNTPKKQENLNIVAADPIEIEWMQMQELIANNPVLEYNVNIEAQYVKLENIPMNTNTAEVLEIGIGNYSIQADYSKIEAFYNKVEKKKEQFLEKLAMLPPLEF